VAASTDQAAAAAEDKPAPNIVVSHTTDTKTDDKKRITLRHDAASDNNDAVKQGCGDEKETLGVKVDNTGHLSIVTLLPKPDGNDQLTVARKSAAAVDVVQSPDDDGLVACDGDISDNSLHFDTQLQQLCDIADPRVGDVNKVTDALRAACVHVVPTTDSDKVVLENELFDASAELDSLGPSSATCQFMKEFSTQRCMIPTNAAAVTDKMADVERKRCDVDVVQVEPVADPQELQPDLSVNTTPELVAASNFDRICAVGGNEIRGQIVYSEELLFDDGDQSVQVQTVGERKNRHSVGLNNAVTTDSGEKLAADDYVENKSDLFASYIVEPGVAVRADVCHTDLPSENSFGLEHDSLTSTMLDRAMAVVNQPDVGNPLQAIKGSVVSASDAKMSNGTDADVGSEQNKPRTEEPPGIDAEAALNLLCESFHKSTKKPPKRKGRKRNSNSAERPSKSNADNIEEKKRRTLSYSPQLLAESLRADLNEAVCGEIGFSVSFGSTSDSSAYVAPTPPSTSTDKSNVNTPRRLLGGVAGVTPVKSDHSVSKVREVKKTSAQSDSCTDMPTEPIASAVAECNIRPDDKSPPLTQCPWSSQSFTIIDVASNRHLFDTFTAEWQRQQTFSLSLACEKRPEPQSRRSTEGIGHKFTRGNEIEDLDFK